jgi:glycosyltransferase involved in cell wall biosynthesis
VARRAADFDVLFANSQKALVVGALAARMAGKKLIWYLHDILTADHFSALNRKVSATLGNRCADRVIANSEASRQAFIACGGSSKRTTVVYNGIDAASDSETEIAAAARQVRGEFGWNGAKVVGVFSRLAPWKGQQVMLDALAQIPELHAIFVGAPLFGDEMCYQRELEARTETLGLTKRVRFLGFREDIPALLQAVDLVAHTSVAPEPFGRVIVEGMLAGKPVVATRAGGACEIIEDGVTGRLVTPGDPDALAQILRGLIERPEEARRLGRAGQVSAGQRFSVETMLRGIEREVAAVMGPQNVEF